MAPGKSLRSLLMQSNARLQSILIAVLFLAPKHFVLFRKNVSATKASHAPANV